MRVHRRLSAYAFTVSLVSASLTHAATDPTYVALRAARPDGRQIAVANLTLDRDAYRFTLDSGTLHFLAPVEGRTFGAVFVGRGSYRLIPASESERRHLALLSGDDRLEAWSDSFERALFLFADDTYEALAAEYPVATGAPAAVAMTAFDDLHAWQRARDKFGTNFHLRILRDLLDTPNSRNCSFLVLVDGKRLSPALAAVDPLGADAIGLATGLGGEDVVLYSGDESQPGFWYLSHRRWELERNRPSPYRPPGDARHYRVESRVVNNTEIEGETTVTFETLTDGLRVLPLHLMRKLRISDVQWTPGDGVTEPVWQPAPWVQEGEREDPDPAIVFPAPLARGTVVTARLRYAGDEVLADFGEKNFVVTARTTWYPNLGTFTDLATYDLAFHVPARSEVIATGELLSSSEERDGVVSRWRSTTPLRVAGFNYGRFKKIETSDAEAGLAIEVYTNPGTPDFLRQIEAALRSRLNSESQSGGGFDLDNPSPTDFNVAPAPSVATINTSTLAESALVDATNAGRVFRSYFGPTSFGRIAITQQSQWSFGQSWPTLVFLPYWSFLHGGLRAQIGLQGIRDADAEGLTYHELSHQWWGHEVGWASYRDQWLSEGFAQFSAVLALQLTRGWGAADRILELERKSLFERPAGNAVTNDAAGPISLGWRLFTGKTPNAVNAVLYGKGGFVLHMLRMMMREGSGANADARFIAMMHEFVTSFAGKSPSTADFQKVAEKNMAPTMNATGDGKLDWFFRQWVYGTEIPELASDLTIRKESTAYRVTGTISQSRVSDDFRTLVPLYVELAGKKGGVAKVASIPIIGSSTRQIDLTINLPAAPKRAFLNAHYDVLTRD